MLSGCAGLIIAGGATGAVVATDRRTTGSFLDDEGIELKANSAISDDPALKDVHINVTSLNGVVLLTGEAPTTGERDRILTHARGVPCPSSIVNGSGSGPSKPC